MLPDTDTKPSCCVEAEVSVTVSGFRGVNFVRPEFGVGRCHRVVLRTSVPKATIEKYRDPGATEDEICGTPQVLDRAGRHPIPEAESVHC